MAQELVLRDNYVPTCVNVVDDFAIVMPRRLFISQPLPNNKYTTLSEAEVKALYDAVEEMVTRRVFRLARIDPIADPNINIDERIDKARMTVCHDPISGAKYGAWLHCRTTIL